jgi:hypothetical protein
MNNKPMKTKTRREFIREGIRIALVGGFASLGISLGRRALSEPGESGPCPIDAACRGCSALTACRDSRAVQVREVEAKSESAIERKDRGGSID